MAGSRYFLEGERPIPSGGHRGPGTQPRILLMFALAVVVFGFFLGRIAWLQTVEGAQYRLLADRNRFKETLIEAPRGVLYDRNGEILVRNEPSFDVTIIPADLPEDENVRGALFARLGAMIDMPVSNAAIDTQDPDAPEKGIVELVRDGEITAPYQPVVIKANVSRELAFAVAENSVLMPGVSIAVRSIRYYPAGGLTGDMVGYTAGIPEERKDDYIQRGYDPAFDTIGASGLEAYLEQSLRGQKGKNLIETDVAGKVLRTVEQLQRPIPGHNVVLTIDLNLQRIARTALEKGIATAQARLGHTVRQGVVVALDPRNGEILAMVSLPDYDNNAFADGISLNEWEHLNNDPYTPLINHAVLGQYPPGSTFKMVTAAAALEEGVVQPETQLFDPGVVYLANRFAPTDPGRAQRFVCWLTSGHGWIDVRGALAQSCDVFFYKVGGGFPDEKLVGVGDTKLAGYSRAFGFGATTGIDLPSEAEGLVPDNKWKRYTYAETWSTGDTYNFSIGQGFLTVTPLQLANMVATIANGGTLYRPHLIKSVLNPDGTLVTETAPEVLHPLTRPDGAPISPQTLTIIREGMRNTVLIGTVKQLPWPEGLSMGAKTGTAEFCDDIAQRLKLCTPGRVLPTHAWFVAFAPYENPEIAIAVFVYNGGEGSGMAAPIAGEILSQYYHRPLVMPEPPAQTGP